MNLRISGRHMDVGDAFRIRIEERVEEAVEKYFDGNYAGTIVVSKETSRFSADCTLHLDTGVIFQAAGRAHDPDAAFADAAERIEKRLRRYKRRLKDHKGLGRQREMTYQIMEAIPEEAEDVPEDYAPAIIAETTLPVATHSVASAVMALDRQDGPVVLFRNAQSGELNLVFRRPDGHYGWVDTSNYAEQ